MKIGILGTRGIPNNYGGFEHFAAHLSRGLVEREHDVTVYNSHKHPFHENEWHGVKLEHCYDPEYLLGGAGQFIYDFNCIMDARKKNFDILLILGYTSSSVWGNLYPRRSVIITNMDGLEWKRSKFSKPVQWFLKAAEKWAVRSSDYHIADSPVIKNYLDEKYKIDCRYIAYGANTMPNTSLQILDEFQLQAGKYYLLMARMEPENNIEMILDGFTQSKSTLPIAVIGNLQHGYGEHIYNKFKGDARVKFLGAVFEEEKVQSLTANCKLYFHGHSVGGTNPSLLDAMAAKAPLAAHKNPFNESVLEENARYFSAAGDITSMINDGNYYDAEMVERNFMKIENHFSWESIIDKYERYFFECCPTEKSFYSLQDEKAIALSGQYGE